MQIRRALVVVGAGVCAGVAAWFTRAVLDVTIVQGNEVRVAMFPSLARMPMLVLLLGVAGGIVVATVARHRRIREPAAAHAVDLLLPLFALGCLTLPYFPWLSDRIPGLRMLAGPMGGILWAIVLGQCAWTAASGTRRERSNPPLPGDHSKVDRRRLASRVGLVGLCGLCAYAIAASRLTSTPIFPSGGEPYYLLVAQSVWRDGDLRTRNNRAQRDHREYFEGNLEPRLIARGADDEEYSVNPVGLSFLIAPIYALGGYSAVIGFLIVIGAASGALMWRWAAARSGSPAAATFAWLAVCLSAPYLLSTIAVYPEGLAGLCILVLLYCGAESNTPFYRTVLPGLALAALPWLNARYVLVALVLGAIVSTREFRHGDRDWRRRAIVLLSPLIISIAGWLVFSFLIWGTPLPLGSQNPSRQNISLQTLLAGGPGLLFDQEFGVAVVAPALLIGFTGLVAMWRRGNANERRRATEIAWTFGALLVTAGAERHWWGSSSLPGQPLASGLLLLGLPIAHQYARSAGEPRRRAVYQLLALVGATSAAALVFARGGTFIPNDGDGSSRLLEWLSHGWPMFATLPSFVTQSPLVASGIVVVWAGVCTVAARLMFPERPVGKAGLQLVTGRSALVAVTTGLALLIVASAFVSFIFASKLETGVLPPLRPEVSLLSQYDASARPLAVVYSPFHRVRPEEVPPLFELRASAEDEGSRGRRRMLLNARFSLPAGRYQLEIAPKQAAEGPVMLQIGREGPPLQQWRAALVPGRTWRAEFALPIDATALRFEGSGEIEEAIDEIRVRPIAILDAAIRPSGPEVVAAIGFTSASMILHDDNGWMEPTGLWTRGGATTELTIVPTAGAPVVVRLRNGPRNNSIVLETAGWEKTVDLQPEQEQDVELPSTDRPGGAIQLRVITANGFTPASVDPESRDRRLLGCWIEVADGERLASGRRVE